ncbi:MAG TPA: hypothetical protein DCS29_03215 [Candidatus Magasanikbacteria bacterium]|nr:MAG: hypothetical protein A2479_01910 [Candidatus Magasanikbacteria bacterium RIFOXYC2_FULL_39_8]HAT03755.1 hypothetical protein [Candidatus Magasanikbacteria bacterium]
MNNVSEIKRKKNESFEGFMRRVKQTWLRSGKILQARKIQYFVPAKSKNTQRKQAVAHAKLVSRTDYLRKTGKLPPEENKKNKKK